MYDGILDFTCLWPRSKPDAPQLMKHSSDSITLELPSIRKDPKCKNISMASVEYTLYYGVINDQGVSNCTGNMKSCSQAVNIYIHPPEYQRRTD